MQPTIWGGGSDTIEKEGGKRRGQSGVRPGRAVRWAFGGTLNRVKWLVLAIVRLRSPRTYGRAKEAAGIYACECYADCWCKKPGLSLFRWVFPRFHHLPVNEGGVPLDARDRPDAPSMMDGHAPLLRGVPSLADGARARPPTLMRL